MDAGDGGLGLGPLPGDVVVHLLAGPGQPGGAAGQQGAGRAKHHRDGHLGQPDHAPILVEEVEQADDQEGPAAGDQGREGEIEAERRTPPLEQGPEHVAGRDQSHHLVADAAQRGAQEIEQQAVGQAQAAEPRRHHAGA